PHMSVDRVVTSRHEEAYDTDLRWASVLEAFLAASPALSQRSLAESDDPSAAAAILQRASGAEVQVAPTKVVGGTAIVAAQPDFDQLVGRVFGTPEPVRVFVQNGTGRPSVGESVARDLLPAGFRIVLSENASSFDHETTTIT